MNVFALSRSPKTFSPPPGPYWRVWLHDGKGNGHSWGLDDSRSLEPDWHHFAVPWDHGRPLLQMLIDGVVQISTDDYLQYWPSEISQQVLIGTWVGKAKIHYVNTLLWRPILRRHFLDDAWMKAETQSKTPTLPE